MRSASGQGTVQLLIFDSEADGGYNGSGYGNTVFAGGGEVPVVKDPIFGYGIEVRVTAAP